VVVEEENITSLDLLVDQVVDLEGTENLHHKQKVVDLVPLVDHHQILNHIDKDTLVEVV
tara:strand:+ start:72 stop:248 length:177 start_codon:yes stop_codon:yes gene_type:complete